jgi:hypothetical protein
MWSSCIGDTPFNDGLALRLHGAGRVWAAEFKYSTKVVRFSVCLLEFLFNDNRGVALRVAYFSNL